jgi:hypothetical protein
MTAFSNAFKITLLEFVAPETVSTDNSVLAEPQSMIVSPGAPARSGAPEFESP